MAVDAYIIALLLLRGMIFIAIPTPVDVGHCIWQVVRKSPLIILKIVSSIGKVSVGVVWY